MEPVVKKAFPKIKSANGGEKMLYRIIIFLLLILLFSYLWLKFEKVEIKVIGQSRLAGVLQNDFEEPFFKTLEKNTGLPVKVNYYPFDTTGFKDEYQLKMLKASQLDLVSLRMLQNQNSEPMLMGLDIPGMSYTLKNAKAIADVYFPVLNDQLIKMHNTKLLGLWTFGPQVFFCNFPIKGLHDLTGRKIRVGNELYNEPLIALNAIPVVIGFNDVENALQKKLVDCAITSKSSAAAAGWLNHTTHVFPLPMQMGINAYVINKNIWNKFSDEQKIKLQEAFDLLLREMWAKADFLDQEYSQCISGKLACPGKRFYKLTEIKPSKQDYKTLHNLFSKISLENWINDCELQRPGCKSKWMSTIQPVLQKILIDHEL
jgi:TRAP-type C4-dicarboxylate transport system substrate-binding protein